MFLLNLCANKGLKKKPWIYTAHTNNLHIKSGWKDDIYQETILGKGEQFFPIIHNVINISERIRLQWEMLQINVWEVILDLYDFCRITCQVFNWMN